MRDCRLSAMDVEELGADEETLERSCTVGETERVELTVVFSVKSSSSSSGESKPLIGSAEAGCIRSSVRDPFKKRT